MDRDILVQHQHDKKEKKCPTKAGLKFKNLNHLAGSKQSLKLLLRPPIHPGCKFGNPHR